MQIEGVLKWIFKFLPWINKKLAGIIKKKERKAYVVTSQNFSFAWNFFKQCCFECCEGTNTIPWDGDQKSYHFTYNIGLPPPRKELGHVKRRKCRSNFFDEEEHYWGCSRLLGRTFKPFKQTGLGLGCPVAILGPLRASHVMQPTKKVGIFSYYSDPTEERISVTTYFSGLNYFRLSDLSKLLAWVHRNSLKTPLETLYRGADQAMQFLFGGTFFHHSSNMMAIRKSSFDFMYGIKLLKSSKMGRYFFKKWKWLVFSKKSHMEDILAFYW